MPKVAGYCGPNRDNATGRRIKRVVGRGFYGDSDSSSGNEFNMQWGDGRYASGFKAGDFQGYAGGDLSGKRGGVGFKM